MSLKAKLIGLFLIFCSAVNAQEHKPENDRNPFAGNAEAIAAGQRLYEQTCQACHGTERAPALSGRLKYGTKDGEIFLNIRNGIAGTQMPPFRRLTADQVWQLVSYIRSLEGTVSVTAARVGGSAAAGEELFFGKANCAACHEINGRGGVIGPDLSGIGTMTAEMLRQQILAPGVNPNPNSRGRRRSIVVVKTKAGRELRGLRRNEDTYTLLLTDLTGTLHRFDKNDLAEVRIESGSLMPSDYGQRLSGPELQDLIAYLKNCTGRDLNKTAHASLAGGLTSERLIEAAAEPHNWLTYWGDYRGHHFSTLKQINTTNVKQLQARWAVQMPGDSLLEATPLVIDGIMYTSGMPGQVFALDARTGLQIWKYERKQKVVNPYETNRFNRGVSVLGQRVFFGTLDAALIALDARTGLPLWEVQVADTMLGYSITSPPLVVKDKLIVGVAGGEYGIRGFLAAYDTATGKQLWRFETVPGPGEFGNDTWPGDTWKRGGSGTWLPGSYDPESDTLYWTVGNPGPDIDADIRRGDNLFSDSVIALDPNTGKRKWHYQFTPNDSHDWDANEDLILVDRVWQGQPRKLIMQANRNGFFYVLDRTNGKFLLAMPFVKQTWNAGFTAEGRPIFAPNSQSSPEGNIVYPSLGGGTNFQAPSYDAATGLLYLVYSESGNRYVRAPAEFEAGKQYWNGRTLPTGEPSVAGVKAIDTTTGASKWDYKISQGSLAAGVLATAGGVVFAATREGNLIALAAHNGEFLWRFQTGATIAASPMSYAVNGKQYIAVASAGVLYSFALPE